VLFDIALAPIEWSFALQNDANGLNANFLLAVITETVTLIEKLVLFALSKRSRKTLQ